MIKQEFQALSIPGALALAGTAALEHRGCGTGGRRGPGRLAVPPGEGKPGHVINVPSSKDGSPLRRCCHVMR